MTKPPWIVYKFGGSSLADAACFRRVAELVLAADRPRVGVVVSAMGGMTDELLELSRLAEAGDTTFTDRLAGIGERYAEAAEALLDGDAKRALLEDWSNEAESITDVLNATVLVRSSPQRSRDVVAGFGEIWSARLLAATLDALSPDRGTLFVDAREVISVHETELGPTVLWDRSRAGFERTVPADFSGIAVATGFIASDEEGLQTTPATTRPRFSRRWPVPTSSASGPTSTA